MKRLAVTVVGLPATALLVFGGLLMFGGLSSPGPFTSGFIAIGFLMIAAGLGLFALARAVSTDRVSAPIALGIVGLAAATAFIGFKVLVPPEPDPCPVGVTGTGTDGWSTTGSMATPRVHPAIALLTDGRVLVAGGVSGAVCGDLNSAELYDPATQTWGPTGSSTESIGEGQPAVVLSDGRVLVVGARPELYDPTTGSWTLTASTRVARIGGGGVVKLRDGRVLVAGGIGEDAATTSSSEIYDPSTGQWTRTGAMSDARSDGPAATLLQDGRVLVAGGNVRLQADGFLTSAELYDPTSGTWSATGDMVVAIPPPSTGVLLQDGRVLVLGGVLAQLFDPTTGSWTRISGPTASQGTGAVVALIDGRVLVAGGGTYEPAGATAAAELYDPETEAWTLAGSMGAARVGAAAVLLSDGRVLVVGGGALNTAELYEPAS